jgi:hypothetical protein
MTIASSLICGLITVLSVLIRYHHCEFFFHTQCCPKVLGLLILKIKDTYGRHTPFLIQNKFHWHIQKLLRGRTASEKLSKILLFGTSLIYQLRLLGSQQHPQSGDLLTSFSTWGTENSLAEINLESTVGDKGL